MAIRKKNKMKIKTTIGKKRKRKVFFLIIAIYIYLELYNLHLQKLFNVVIILKSCHKYQTNPLATKHI